MEVKQLQKIFFPRGCKETPEMPVTIFMRLKQNGSSISNDGGGKYSYASAWSGFGSSIYSNLPAGDYEAVFSRGKYSSEKSKAGNFTTILRGATQKVTLL